MLRFISVIWPFMAPPAAGGHEAVPVQVWGSEGSPAETFNRDDLPRNREDGEPFLLLLLWESRESLWASGLVRHQHRRRRCCPPGALQRKELFIPKKSQQRPAEAERGRGRWGTFFFFFIVFLPVLSERWCFPLCGSRRRGAGPVGAGLAQPLQLLPDVWRRHQDGGGRLQAELSELWVPQPAGRPQHMLPKSRYEFASLLLKHQHQQESLDKDTKKQQEDN